MARACSERKLTLLPGSSIIQQHTEPLWATIKGNMWPPAWLQEVVLQEGALCRNCYVAFPFIAFIDGRVSVELQVHTYKQMCFFCCCFFKQKNPKTKHLCVCVTLWKVVTSKYWIYSVWMNKYTLQKRYSYLKIILNPLILHKASVLCIIAM